MTQGIEVKGLKELLTSMTKYPVELAKVVGVTMDASLRTLHENVPAYPVVPNPVRDGTLGRSLGSGMNGGALGQPSIYEVKPLGEGNYEGRFGTNLSYADFVIGEAQAWMHYRWWQLKQVAQKAAAKIERLWQKAGELLAEFLEGKKGV